MGSPLLFLSYTEQICLLEKLVLILILISNEKLSS